MIIYQELKSTKKPIYRGEALRGFSLENKLQQICNKCGWGLVTVEEVNENESRAKFEPILIFYNTINFIIKY